MLIEPPSLILSALYVAHWLGGAGTHWLMIPTILLSISACVIKHNHIHHATFRHPFYNRAFNVWLGLLTGTSTTGIRIAHNQRHHRSSQSPEDFVRCSLVREKSAWAALLSFFPLVIFQTWLHAAQDGASLRRRSIPLHKLLRLERIALWILIFGTFCLNWRQFFWVFPIPWFIGQWFLVTINLLQHDGLTPEDKWRESRNVVGFWSNWLFFNNGYHTAHHVRPALHWSLLQSYHKRDFAPHLPMDLIATSLPGLVIDWMNARSSKHPTDAAPISS